MNYVKHHRFGPVNGYEFGFSPIGKPLKTVYIYFHKDILVDTAQYHLRRQISSIASCKQLSTILLTHHHEDHSGNCENLRSLLNVPVFGHSYAKAKLMNGFPILPYQHILFGKALPTKITEYRETIETSTLTITPYHTPGHSKDHTVYLDKKHGILFSGDLYIGPKIQFFRVDEKIGEQIRSLKKVLHLDFDLLLCAHNPVMKNGKNAIQKKLQFLEDFRGGVSNLLNMGLLEKEIVKRLKYKSDFGVKLFTMGNASFTHMVRSAVSDCQTVSEHETKSP